MEASSLKLNWIVKLDSIEMCLKLISCLKKLLSVAARNEPCDLLLIEFRVHRRR